MTNATIMGNNGFSVQHTGGGCMAWEKLTADRSHFVWICDGGNGLGENVPADESDWIVGAYSWGGDWWIGHEDSLTLADALKWADDAIYAMEVI